jgi:DNA polymerase (family 10)
MKREMGVFSAIGTIPREDHLMDRKSAARTLREIGRLLEIAGENPYRVRAFSNAARAVETTAGELDELVGSGKILEVKGIGKGTAAVLADLVEGRRPLALAEAEEIVPPGVRELMSLPGLGPKKVRTLWRDLGVETVGELEYACRENRLLDLTGFGPASQAAVLEAVEFRNRVRARRLLHEGWAAAEIARARLVGLDGVVAVEIAGELRRRCETVGELSLVVTLEADSDEPGIARVFGEAQRVAERQWFCRCDEGIDLRLWFSSPAAGGATMVRATGSEDFLEALDARAAAIGDQVAVFSGGDEARVFDNLGLPPIPPELREDGSWIQHAADHGVPALAGAADLLGVLHNHTTDSDGLASLEEMAAAAAERGWSFFGVADHSPAAFYANGVDGPRLREQWARADAWNSTNAGTRIVKGLEADILGDGRLDIPDGCESGLDYVVASVHSGFRMTEVGQTERIVAAVRHPACRVLGHPTGRLLLARPGYEVDLERVLDVCAEEGVAVEINASPYRLDLDWRWARRALDKGLQLVINPDAHSVEGLDDVRWGVSVARKAGATAADLVNCVEIDDFLAR